MIWYADQQPIKGLQTGLIAARPSSLHIWFWRMLLRTSPASPNAIQEQTRVKAGSMKEHPFATAEAPSLFQTTPWLI